MNIVHLTRLYIPHVYVISGPIVHVIVCACRYSVVRPSETSVSGHPVKATSQSSADMVSQWCLAFHT